MALETGTYIDSLNAANPAATDALSQADDHLRLLKSTVKATFPNVAGAITGTHTAINAKVSEDSPAWTLSSTGNIQKNSSNTWTNDYFHQLAGIKDPAIFVSTNTEDAADKWPTLSSGITAAEIRSLIGAAEAATTATLLAVYPVGAIYTSVAVNNPGTLFGGTWDEFGQGKVLIGKDATDSDFDTNGNTGGSKTHTLTVDEMPSHTHNMTIENTRGTGSDGAEDGASSFSTVDTSSTGGGQAHNNMPPYIVVYMWKRVQ